MRCPREAILNGGALSCWLPVKVSKSNSCLPRTPCLRNVSATDSPEARSLDPSSDFSVHVLRKCETLAGVHSSTGPDFRMKSRHTARSIAALSSSDLGPCALPAPCADGAIFHTDWVVEERLVLLRSNSSSSHVSIHGLLRPAAQRFLQLGQCQRATAVGETEPTEGNLVNVVIFSCTVAE